ncbi:aminopeptidase P N-terminal domain-containing protein [Neisseria sp. Ec49-e6-T10]|uniref:aminopeptidase P N-terminal domain-containing protein n=1 Tax=Neisseria sp. Ec49-e6-T10 TaxID=3140744 RepID=UPI003EB72FAD
MNINTDVYQKRRKIVLSHLNNGVAVLFAAPEQRRSNDTYFAYRQDSYFYYLTGFNEPESALILDGKTGQSILFCRNKDQLRETWDGFRFGPQAAQEIFAFSKALPIDEFDEQLLSYLKGADTVSLLLGLYPDQDQRVLQLWQKAKAQMWAGINAPKQFTDLSLVLNQMRLIKDEYELSLLKQAGAISAKAHIVAMQKTQPNQYEYQVEAELLHTFVSHGARYPAYESIVASGKNACTLHYVNNQSLMKDSDLLLIDAGAEFQGYAGDITRTFPVNGVFSGAQKEVYEAVLNAQLATIAAIKPNISWQAVSDIALKALVQGLIDLKILSGTVEGAIESGAYKRFYMHGIGHWIGLDVHDVGGRFDEQGQPLLLQKGMCTTVEPGLYISAADDVPKAFHNIGVRIEDNVVVTELACEVYTADVPKTVAQIEALMKNQ